MHPKLNRCTLDIVHSLNEKAILSNLFHRYCVGYLLYHPLLSLACVFSSMSNTPKLSRFVRGTLRFDSIRTLCLNSIRTESCLANRLPAWQIENRGNDLCWFDRIDLNQQHFQPTLHSPPEVKIHEITIHESSSFLKRGHKLRSIHMILVGSIKSTWIANIFNPPSKSRSTIFSKSRINRLPACRIDRRGNDSCRFDGIGFTNRFPVCRIANTKDESTLVGCIGRPSVF